MEFMDVFLVVAMIALIMHILLIALVGSGIWKLVRTTNRLLETADSGLTSIKHKLIGVDAEGGVETAKMITQGVLGITRVVFGSKKKKRHTK